MWSAATLADITSFLVEAAGGTESRANRAAEIVGCIILAVTVLHTVYAVIDAYIHVQTPSVLTRPLEFTITIGFDPVSPWLAVSMSLACLAAGLGTLAYLLAAWVVNLAVRHPCTLGLTMAGTGLAHYFE